MTSGLIGAALATLVIGVLVALQPPVNSELGRLTSDLGAAFVSVTITFLVLLVIFLAFGDVSSLAGLSKVPIGYLAGGLFGAAFVAISLITVRTLGASLTVALLVSAQLIVAAILDHFGLLGLEETPLSLPRVAGIGALLVGTVLVSVDVQ